jgi:peptidoglycan/LPS O-acetylase OafA/YrhL
MTPPPKPRSLRLDVLRAAAVVMVFCFHGHSLLPLSFVDRVGWAGVDLFFVLSGFLVSGLLFADYKATGAMDWGRFFVRRGFKIYPPFYLYLLLSVPVEAVFFDRPPTAGQLWAECLWVQNYGPRFWNHDWSLAVEEHFYLLLPPALLAVAWLRRKHTEPLRPVPLCVLLLGVAVLALRTYTAWRGFRVYGHTHLRLDALAAGVAIAWAWHFRREAFVALVRRWRFALALLAAGNLAAMWWPFELDTFALSSVGLTVNYLGMACLLAFTLSLPTPGRAVAALLRPVARFGAYSYRVYLWHLPAIEWVRRSGAEGRAAFAVAAGLTLVLGVGTAVLVEGPSLRVRDRLFPAKAGALR